MNVCFKGKSLANVPYSTEPRVLHRGGTEQQAAQERVQQTHVGREGSTFPYARPLMRDTGTLGSIIGSGGTPKLKTTSGARGHLPSRWRHKRSVPAPLRPSATPLLAKAQRSSQLGTHPRARAPRARAGSPVLRTLPATRRRRRGD